MEQFAEMELRWGCQGVGWIGAMFMVVAGGVCAEVGAREPVSCLSLEAAVELALRENASLRAAAARVEGAEARAAAAGLWPGAAVEVGFEDGPAAGVRSLSEAKQTVGLTQTFPWPGKKRLDRQVGRMALEVEQAERRIQQIELVREVKVAFLRILAAEEALGMIEELEQAAEAALSAAKERVAAGDASELEPLRLEIGVARVRNEAAVWRERRQQGRATLALLLGRPDLQEARLCGPGGDLIERARAVLSVGATPAVASPVLEMARLQQQQAELEWRRARLEAWPDPHVTVAAGRGAAPGRDAVVELRLSFPLPPWDGGQSRRRESWARMQETAALADAVIQRHQFQVKAARARVASCLERAVRYRDEMIPKAVASLQGAERAAAEGRWGLVDVLTARQTLAELRLASVEQWLELGLALADLEALEGSADALFPREGSSGTEDLP